MNNKKVENIYYMKTFSTIAEGLKDMNETLKLTENFKVFKDFNFNLLSEDDTEAYKEIFYHLTEAIRDDFPSIWSRDYPNTYSFSMFGDNFFFRTKDEVSFSWEYDRKSIDDDKTSIKFFIIIRNVNRPYMKARFEKTKSALESNEWKNVEPTEMAKYNRRSNNRKNKDNNLKKQPLKTTIGESISEDQKNSILNIEDRVSTGEFVETNATAVVNSDESSTAINS